MSHTKGPWRVWRNTYIVRDLEGGVEMLASTSMPSGRGMGPLAEQHANARLVAAAPETTDALAELLEAAENESAPTTAQMERAREALRKARGG